MNKETLQRPMTVFWLEAMLATGLLSLLGYLPTRFGAMLGFTLLAACLLGLGAWLYQGGGRSMWLHLLLYPLTLALGIVSYLWFASWIVALAISGAFFWRIHTVVSTRIYHFDLLRRFGFTVVVYLAALVYHALIVSLTEAGTAGVPHLFGMLAALLISYVLTSEGEFLTREKPVGVSVPAGLRMRFTWELGQVKLLALGAYVAVASLLLLALSFIWSLVSRLLGPLLHAVVSPLLALIEQWINQLVLTLSKDRRLDLVTGKDGKPGNVIDHGMSGQEETLFSLLQPYLIAGIVLAFACWLGWKMWQRRRRSVSHADASEAVVSTARLARIDAQAGNGAGLGGVIQSFLDRFSAPREDQARYLYYQFLRYMKAQGMPMRKDETSQEFLQRIAEKWPGGQRLSLATQLTDLYQRHRYQQQVLTHEELAAMDRCFQELKKG